MIRPCPLNRATGPKAYKENLEGYYANDEDKILQSTDMEKCYFVLNLRKGKFSFFQASFRVHFMPTENVINQIDSQENSHWELFSIFLKDDKHEFVKLKVDCEEFTFNKFLLCNYSEVFQSMFNSGFEEANTNTVVVQKTTPTAVKSLKSTLYGQDMRDEELDIELLMLADKYQVPQVFKLCLDNIFQQIGFGNVIGVIKASLFLQNDILMDKSIMFLANSRKLTVAKMLKSEDWKLLCSLFHNCETEVIQKIKQQKSK